MSDLSAFAVCVARSFGAFFGFFVAWTIGVCLWSWATRSVTEVLDDA